MRNTICFAGKKENVSYTSIQGHSRTLRILASHSIISRAITMTVVELLEVLKRGTALAHWVDKQENAESRVSEALTIFFSVF